MKIKSIMIDNYAPFDKTKIELEDGAYIVVGENNTDQQVSSNGAGKSCLIQALIWCLFGEIVRPGLKVDEIVGPLRKYVRVVVEFEKDGHEWKIDRARHFPGRKSNEPLVWIDGEEVTQHKKNDEFIQQQLGFSFTVFMFAGYSDADHPPFSTLTPANLLKAFAEVLELHKISSAVERIKHEIVPRFDGQTQDLLRSQYRLEEKLSSSRALVEKLTNRLNEFENEKTRELISLEAQISDLEEELERMDDFSVAESNARQILQAIEKELAVVDSKNKRIKVLKKESDDLILKISKHEGNLKKIKTEVAAKKKEWSNLAENNSCICDYCGSKFDKAEAVQRASLIMDEVDTMLVDIANQEATIRNFNLKLDPIKREMDTIQESLENAQDLYNDKQTVMFQIQKIERDKKRKADIKMVLLPDLYKRHDKLTNQSIEFEQTLLDEQYRLLNELESEVEEADKQLVLLEERKAKSISLAGRLNKLKITMMEDFLYSLEAQVNFNLAKMGTDLRCSMALNMGTSLRLLFTNGSKEGTFYPYSIFSRGEKAKIDKACAIALNEVFNIGLYIDDEGLSGVDWEASKGLLDFLCESDYTRLLVFHNERIQSSIDLKGVGKIVVAKSEGKSNAKIKN